MTDLVPFDPKYIIRDHRGQPLLAFARREQPGVLALCPENAQAIAAEPLLLVPPVVRPAIYTLWGMNEEIYRTPGPLAMVFAVFIHEHGLLPEDAAEICRTASRPDIMAELGKASDLKTRIAVEAKHHIARRRNEAKAKRLRDEADQADRSGAVKLADIFADWGATNPEAPEADGAA